MILGIPFIVVATIIVVIMSAFAFLVYILILKKKLKIYSKAFGDTIEEFESNCNPGHPMTDEAWGQYRSSHDADFEHARKVASSKLIAFFVKDLENANRLVDIDNNHQAYMDDAEKKHMKIQIVENHLASAIRSKVNLFNETRYVAHSESEKFVEAVRETYDAAKFCIKNKLEEYISQKRELSYFVNFMDDLESNREVHNINFVESELKRCSDYFDHVLPYPLDEQQREAIVVGEDNCLVVSSAGSGKTSTINGKVRYLLDELKVDPDDILLITYTRKAAEELRNRIACTDLRAYTFHGFAHKIISEVDVKPTFCEKSLTVKIFESLLHDKDFIESVTYYLVNLLSRIKDPEKYENEKEYIIDRRKYGIVAYFPDMDGNKIYTKSEQERKICHFLSTHNVCFRYEQSYEYDTATSSRRQYKPDFTIYFKVNGEERHIYLEHFGIDKNGNVPKWFGQNTGTPWDAANREYNDGIRWKRRIHKDNGTTLIETTSAMFSDGTWQDELLSQLAENHVPVKERPAEEIFQELVENEGNRSKTVHDLIVAFVSLLKANCKTINEVLEKARKIKDDRGIFIIEKMVRPFYEAYEKTLKERGEIDFTDAILKATDFCNSGAFKRRYKYIIVDEFQDISFDRYKLLLAIRSQMPLGKIFAVGDDWQSIYRFSGSDLGLFSDFEKYFGFTEQCRIEKTYRFAQPTIGISSNFILKNKSQVKKEVKPFKHEAETGIKFESYTEEAGLAESVANKIRSIPEDESIYILSRYSFDFNNVFSGRYPIIEKDKISEVTIGHRTVKCLTVHKAKGLEADHIFILKCNSDVYGFPSMITDDPVLEYLLSQNEESIEYAEERRLFYVAITRAKLDTTIFYRKDNPSVFVDEIIKVIEDDDLKKCPLCGYGHLKIIKQGWTRNGDYFVSLGCTNSLGGCDYFHSEYFKGNEPSEQEVQALIKKQPVAYKRRYEVIDGVLHVHTPNPPKEQKVIKIDLPEFHSLPDKRTDFKKMNPYFFPETGVSSLIMPELQYQKVTELISNEITTVLKTIRQFDSKKMLSKSERKALVQVVNQFGTIIEKSPHAFLDLLTDEDIKKAYIELDDIENRFRSFGISIPKFPRPIDYRK